MTPYVLFAALTVGAFLVTLGLLAVFSAMVSSRCEERRPGYLFPPAEPTSEARPFDWTDFGFDGWDDGEAA